MVQDAEGYAAEQEQRLRALEARKLPEYLWRDNLAAAYGIPVGSLRYMAGTTVGVRELLCNGQAVSRTGIYAALFAEIGTTWGAGDGTTTFNVPDLRGRVPVGRDASQAEFDTLGETGGAKTHTLTTAQMPSHNHQLRFAGSDLPGGIAGSSAGGGFVNWFLGSSANTNQLDIGNRGGGDPHNNLQPYAVVNVAIRF